MKYYKITNDKDEGFDGIQYKTGLNVLEGELGSPDKDGLFADANGFHFSAVKTIFLRVYQGP